MLSKKANKVLHETLKDVGMSHRGEWGENSMVSAGDHKGWSIIAVAFSDYAYADKWVNTLRGRIDAIGDGPHYQICHLGTDGYGYVVTIWGDDICVPNDDWK